MALKLDGKAVQTLREANGWTLRDVAAKTDGFSYSYLSKLEKRREHDAPTVTETVLAVAAALEVDPRAITGNQRMFAAALKAAEANPGALRRTPIAA